MKLLFENWRGYLNEEDSSAALNYLENAFKNEHAAGRPFTKLFDEVNEEALPSAALEIVNSITPIYIAEILEKYKATGFKGSINMDDVSDPREIAIINSIMLFTAGNVASVREPEQFKSEDAEELKPPEAVGYKQQRIAAVPKYYTGDITEPKPESGLGWDLKTPEAWEYLISTSALRGDALSYVIKPTKVMYTIARYVMLQIANMKNPDGSTEIYRGMALPPKVAAALKEEMEFSPGRLASWTTDADVADKFASGVFHMSPEERKEMQSSNPEKWKELEAMMPTYFVIKSSEVGAYIGNMSTFKSEHEFILGRKVKIVDIDVVMQSPVYDPVSQRYVDSDDPLLYKFTCEEI